MEAATDVRGEVSKKKENPDANIVLKCGIVTEESREIKGLIIYIILSVLVCFFNS